VSRQNILVRLRLSLHRKHATNLLLPMKRKDRDNYDSYLELSSLQERSDPFGRTNQWG
jgi:hypothetical protein